MISAERSNMVRRVSLYLFGFLFGMVAVNVIYKGKACQMPGTIKLNELIKQKRTFNPKTECYLNCGVISNSSLEEMLKSGKINYDKSKVHDKPFPIYLVENVLNDKKIVAIEIQDRDTISCITAITGISIPDSCRCN